MAPHGHGHHLPHLTLLLLFLIYSPLVLGVKNKTSESNNVRHVKVGVILDTSSWKGGISWSCMQLALEDFYELNPNYRTRISFVLRDLKSGRPDRTGNANGDVFDATVADYIPRFGVIKAIIGPQTSSQAKFLVELRNKSNVPIISFLAKSPSISSSQTPYFIRTSWNFSSQAAVIASIAQKFNWREVVPVFEDANSGNIFVRYLTDTLQGIDTYVPYRYKIPNGASDSEINAALDYLNANRTRVFVVHMSYQLALKFFSSAKEKNMTGTDDFVWITTYGLTDIVNLAGSIASKVMQGVLGIWPFVQNTASLQSVSMKLRNKHQVNRRPTAFGLWAYDRVWLLARSIEDVTHANLSFKASNALYNSTDFSKIGVSEMGPNLKASLESSNFRGISGNFNLVYGQLQSGAFEITNVIRACNDPVGLWTRGNISINWPRKNHTVPKGWQWPTTNNTLVIGVPSKPGFEGFVKPDNKNPHNFSGYSINVFEIAIDLLPYNVSYRFEEFNGTYDELVYQKYHAAVGDITILANRSMYVDFTLPYTESGVRMLAPIKDVNKKSPWTFLEPWTPKLWLPTGAFVFLTGITVWLIEHRINEEFRGDPANQIGSIFYFAFSTLVFAHRERMVSNMSRLVVITWVFVVLILQQSYTASLNSKLTIEQLQATVTSIEQVVKAGQNVGYLNDSFMPDLLKRLGFNEERMISLSSPDEYNEALSNGTVAVVLDEIPYLKVFLKKYAKFNHYSMVGPTYNTDGFGFAFPKGSPLVPDVSKKILQVMESDNMTKLDEELYGRSNFTDKGDTTSSTSLTFHSFMGLFLITGVSSILALIIHAFFSIFQRHNISTSTEAVQNPLQKDELREEDQSSSHTMTSPDFSDNVEVTITSPDSESHLGETSNDEGTPGREISNSEIEMPSFGEMLDHTMEGSNE